MLLTKPQTHTFWRQWSAVIRLSKWTPIEAEQQRKAMLARAGFDSLTLVDKLSGFDRVLAEIKALSQPSDVDAQLRQQNQPVIRLRYRIRHHALQAAYWHDYAINRFATADLDQLNETQLTQLRNFLDDRMVQQRRAGTIAVRSQRTQARRQAAADPEARIKFPDLPPAIQPSAIAAPEPAREFVSGPF